MVDTKQFYDYLLDKGIEFFTGVPDSLLQNICACITENGKERSHIIAANEGNAVAIASGYHIATGKFGVVYMQNSGEGNAVNPLLSLADPEIYSVPMLLMIGWRGEPGIKDEPQHVKQGKVTLDLLDIMGVKYFVLEDDYQPQIDACYDYMKEQNQPVALVIKKGSFSPYKMGKQPPRFEMKREEALEQILGKIGPDSFVVSTTGKTSREIFELREKRGEDHAHDFLTVGSMGHTASIALGMSLGTDKDVYCVDGDGSFLMHLGGMGIAAKNAGKNFKYILINNGAHESVGGQPTIALDIDIPAILKGLGFNSVFTAMTAKEISEGISKLKDTHLGALVVFVNTGSRDDLGRPTVAPSQNKRDMMRVFK